MPTGLRYVRALNTRAHLQILVPFIFAGCDLGYNWFSEDPSVATVDPSGTVHAVGPGQTRVFAAAAFDELNLASTAVRVTVPASLQHVAALPVDGQVGEVAPAAVKLLDAEGRFFAGFSTGFLSFSSTRFVKQ